jgi:hypothetical protein
MTGQKKFIIIQWEVDILQTAQVVEEELFITKVFETFEDAEQYGVENLGNSNWKIIVL